MEYRFTEKELVDYLNYKRQNGGVAISDEMFIKYLKESKYFTHEVFEMFSKKYRSGYGAGEILIDGEPIKFSTYDDYISSIKNLDLSGIAHMTFPILKHYNLVSGGYNMSELTHVITGISEEFPILSASKKSDVANAFKNYQLAGNMLVTYEIERSTPHMILTMSDDVAKKEILGYKKVYGNQNYERVKKLLIERV